MKATISISRADRATLQADVLADKIIFDRFAPMSQAVCFCFCCCTLSRSSQLRSSPTHAILGKPVPLTSRLVDHYRLRSSGSVSTASSEEQTDMLNLGGQGYSV